MQWLQEKCFPLESVDGVLGIGGVVVTSHARGVQVATHLLLVRGQLAAGQCSVI